VDPDTGEVTKQRTGAQIIANEFNAMGLTTNLGCQWTASRIRSMLKWPGYIGKVQWYQRETKITIEDGKRKKIRTQSDKYSLQDGCHEPILDQQTWDELQAAFAARKHGSVNAGKTTSSPFNGLIKCGECGHAIVRTPMYGHLEGIDYLKCSTHGCRTSSAPLQGVEDLILQSLREWLSWVDTNQWPPELAAAESNQSTADLREAAQRQLEDLQRRRLRLMELLEKEVYDITTYTQRNQALSEEMQRVQATLDAIPPAPTDRRSCIKALAPQLRSVLQVYSHDLSNDERHDLLSSVIDHIVYHKTQRAYRNTNPLDYVTLEIYPKTF
jgi:hypothetical protein